MPDPRALNGSLLQLSTPAAILAFASEHASALNSVNCATALHRLAKQGATASAAFAPLVARTASVLRSDARHVTARRLRGENFRH